MGISSYSMYDISGYLSGTTKAAGALKAENTTSRENANELNMTDFLQLMIVQLQSQTLDDTMDTSDMLNQMVQMQMVTALTNMTETNIMTYASSLVGKDVTIGIINADNELEEHPVTITGTAYSNGQYVIFGKDHLTGKIETYNLNQIMAVGSLPPIEEDADTTTPDTTTPGTATPGATTPGTTTPDITDPGESTEEPDSSGSVEDTQTPGDTVDKPVENPDAPVEDSQNPGGADYEGEQGAPVDEA